MTIFCKPVSAPRRLRLCRGAAGPSVPASRMSGTLAAGETVYPWPPFLPEPMPSLRDFRAVHLLIGIRHQVAGRAELPLPVLLEEDDGHARVERREALLPGRPLPRQVIHPPRLRREGGVALPLDAVELVSLR